jgi:hypothetical protein
MGTVVDALRTDVACTRLAAELVPAKGGGRPPSAIHHRALLQAMQHGTWIGTPGCPV